MIEQSRLLDIACVLKCPLSDCEYILVDFKDNKQSLIANLEKMGWFISP